MKPNLLEYAQKHPEDNIEQKNEILSKVKDELKLVLDFITKEIAGK